MSLILLDIMGWWQKVSTFPANVISPSPLRGGARGGGTNNKGQIVSDLALASTNHASNFNQGSSSMNPMRSAVLPLKKMRFGLVALMSMRRVSCDE